MGIIDLLKDIPFLTLLFNICQSLFFVPYIEKTSFLKKNKKIKRIIGGVIFTLFNFLSYIFLLNVDPRIPDILFVFLCFVYSKVFNLNTQIENIILSLVYYITLWSINHIFNNLGTYFKLDGLILDYIMMIINLTIVYFVLAKIISRFIYFKDDVILTNRQNITLLAFCLVGFINLLFYQGNISSMFAAVCDVVIVLLSYDFKVIKNHEIQEKLIKERNALLEKQDQLIKQADAEKYKSYQRSLEADQKLRKINHDLNHHLNYLLTCEDREKAKKYIMSLKGEVNEVDKFYDTGNSLIDIILEEQKEKADKLGITFAVIAGFGEEGLKIDPAQASIFFGNLINNAIEGTSKITDPSRLKKVNVNFGYRPARRGLKGQEFNLIVTNTAMTEGLKIENGLIATTKEDKKFHGIGIKSARQAVKACGGDMEIFIDETIVRVEVNIPVPIK